MHIRSFHIDGFGIFHDFAQRELPSDFVLFYGENEAGKSTLLAFLRAMFFGFATRGNQDLNKYPPLRGGNPSGALSIELRDGRNWNIRRSFTGPKRALEVWDDSHKTFSENDLHAVFSGASKEMYKHVYAFSLEELQSLQSEEIKAALYGATVGSGLKALAHAEREFDSRLTELYGPRAQEREINRRLQQITETRSQVERLLLDFETYNQIQSEIKDLERLLDTKLTAQKIIDDRARTFERLIKQDAKFSTREAKLSDEIVARLIYNHAELLERLLQTIPAMREQLQLSAELAEQAEQREEQLRAGFAELGPDWDVTRLEQVTMMTPQPHDVLAFDQKFTTLEAERLHCQDSLEKTRADLSVREEEFSSAQNELTALATADGDELPLESLEKLKSGSEKFLSDAREADSLDSEIERLKESLQACQQQMKALLDANDLSAGLADLCDSSMLDSTQAALMIANLVNRGPILLNKEGIASADNAAKNAAEAVEAVYDKLSEAEDNVRMIKHSINMLPVPNCATQEVTEAIAVDKGRLTQLFEKIAFSAEEVLDLQEEIKDLRRFIECDLNVESLTCLDLPGLKQAADMYKRDCESIETQSTALSNQIDSLKHSITKFGAKHQLLRTQIKEYEDVENEATSILNSLTSVIELKKLVHQTHQLTAKAEHLVARIADKKRTKEALEQTAAETFARRTLIMAGSVGIGGLLIAGYFALAYDAWIPACITGAITLILVVFMLHMSAGAKPEDSSEKFAKEISALDAELKGVRDEQANCDFRAGKIALSLQLPRSPSLQQCEELEVKLKGLSERVKRRQALLDDASDTQDEIAKLGQEEMAKAAELKVLKRSLEDTKHAWLINVQSAGVRIDAEPDLVMPELIRLVEKSREHAKREAALENDRESLRKIVAFLSDSGISPSDKSNSDSWVKAIDEWLKVNGAAREKHTKRFALEDRLREAEKTMQSVQKDLDEAKAKEINAVAGQKQARLTWQRWLIAAGLPTTLSCDIALKLADTIAAIDEVRSYLRAQVAMVANFRQSTQTYRNLAARVPTIGEQAARISAPELLQLISQATDQAEQRRVRDQERAIIQERAKRLTVSIAEARARLSELDNTLSQNAIEVQKLRSEWKKWLADHSLSTELDTKETAQVLPKISALQSVAYEKGVLLIKHSSYAKQVRSFCAECQPVFAAVDLPVPPSVRECLDLLVGVGHCAQNVLAKEAKEAATKIDGLGSYDASEQLGLRAQIATLIGRRDRLADSTEMQETRQQEECLRKQLEDLSAEWSKYAIAAHLLKLAKERFEREGQPQVIEMASRLFRKLTDDRYLSVGTSMDDSSQFIVENANHARVGAEFLSTGTQEQLYLALRFAFIKHRAAHAEALPVVMDDVLVNFDERRATSAAQAIIDLSQSHQVLYFTCHPSTVATFKSVRPDVQVLSLTDGATADAAIERLIDRLNSTVQRTADRQAVD